MWPILFPCSGICLIVNLSAFLPEGMGTSSLVIVLCLAGAAVVLLVIILLVIYKLKYDRLKVGQDFKGIVLCRWFRFAQLAKGKKFRP